MVLYLVDDSISQAHLGVENSLVEEHDENLV